ncbi:AraC family transcriptional regulator ligand-binding domain-containing protein [Methylocystis parvus]|uniref:AraC family transcriptional regulator n=1 Tax=Methylocystis parvus TaxID=134 RepID=UPI003C73C9C1
MALGFTKARSMGPVADAVERAGGSVARIFRKAELPLRLIETPDQLILLKDQLAVVEYAARELDDETLPLVLSMQAGVRGLGAFGDRVRAAPTLKDAIERCNSGMCAMLQSATHMRLEISGELASWTYFVSDAAVLGRGKNELLAFGYMSETLETFGAGAPLRAELPSPPAARAKLEDMLGCDIVRGDTARLVFASAHLARGNPFCAGTDAPLAGDVPPACDFVGGVEHLLRLGLLDGLPTMDFVGARLGLSPRSLQRRLAEAGARFEVIRRRVLLERAVALLADPRRPITQVAFELGYSDPAHFSRAFLGMTGLSPRIWRKNRSVGGAGPRPAMLVTPAAKA